VGYQEMWDKVMSYFVQPWELLTSLDAGFWISILFVFAATFFGVFLSFWIERSRSRKKEKDEFGRMLQGMLIESANNNGIANNIEKYVQVESTPAFQFNTDVLQLAIASPLFHRWADYSLVKTITIVRLNLQTTNNHLSFYRQASAGGSGITSRGVKDLQIRADTIKKVIAVLQNILDKELPKLGLAIVKDSGSENVDNQLKEIFRSEREQLEKLP